MSGSQFYHHALSCQFCTMIAPICSVCGVCTTFPPDTTPPSCVMASENIYRHILIDEDSVTPKYLQIVNSVLKAVQQGHVGMDYVLPSINDLSFELNIARDTAERAYRQLKKLGVVGSIPGKGYFISDVDIRQDIRVLLLFNKLSAHKKIIYDAKSNNAISDWPSKNFNQSECIKLELRL